MQDSEDRKGVLLARHRTANARKAADLRFRELLADIRATGLAATLQVSAGPLSPPARLLGRHYPVDASRGLVSPAWSDTWSESNLEARLRELFTAEGIGHDAACLLFEADPAWFELSPQTLLALLPHVAAAGMDWALLEASGAWCCYVNRHGNLGFARR